MSMNESDSLSEHDWRRLAQTIKRGNCVLLLGPAVAVDQSMEERLPLTVLLARSLVDKLGPNASVVNPDDLAHVAQLYQGQHNFDRVDLEIAVEEFYKKYDGITTPLHRELAELPFTLCINTTPDSFMATAFAEAGKNPWVEYYHYLKPHNVRLADIDPRHPLVYDLYGNRGELESMVLTESDLLDFLVNVISKTPPLPPSIISRFSAPDTSFLFVGFGFRNWYVRILLHVLQAQRCRTRSLALEDRGFFSHPDQPRTAAFFEREHLIGFKLVSWEDFVSELKQHHDALVGEGVRSAAAKLPPDDAPLSFLCHCHEDHDAVAELAERLQSLGIQVWLDRQNLRGGDDWDRLIPSVLEKVNYVVVVQSQRMQARVESYVYKEVRIALDRQKGFATGYRFIIPTTLDSTAGLSELTYLHTLDIGTPSGVEALAGAILEDWRRRRSDSAKSPASMDREVTR